jgi:hypothetical protein
LSDLRKTNIGIFNILHRIQAYRAKWERHLERNDTGPICVGAASSKINDTGPICVGEASSKRLKKYRKLQ